LCFFNSLQSRAETLKGVNKSKENLLRAVTEAYNEYDAATLERLHALQFEVYRNIMRNKGDNANRQPHSNIRLRQNLGLEVCDLYVPADLALECFDAISNFN
jgi:hypothetical protein